MDAFYASVEQLDNTDLLGKPILVGPPSRRGVVLTASYEARPYQVGSAMPMAEALRRCPHAIVVPPRFERYTELSTHIMAVFRDFSPDVEAISLDEAFLEMTGSEHIFGPPEEMGRKIRGAVLEATGLHASVGVAASKYVAKVASGVCKPNGLLTVAPEQTIAWLAPLPVARLWGAGPKTQARLTALGYHTIGDIAAADPLRLADQLGSAGRHFFELAHGRDPRRVEGDRRSHSMGSERTLNEDVVERVDIERHLQRSADRIARRLRRKDLLAGGVRVRLKTSCRRARPCWTGSSTPVLFAWWD
jgi:DNA polymerase-4